MYWLWAVRCGLSGKAITGRTHYKIVEGTNPDPEKIVCFFYFTIRQSWFYRPSERAGTFCTR